MADVTLPQLGETVTEGTITQWFKAVGDEVAEDEPLFEVSTDKVDTEVPSPVSGTLTEIRAEEGDTVDVGTVIAVVGDGGAAAPAAEAPAAEPEPAPEPEPEPEPAPAPAAAPPAARTRSRRPRRHLPPLRLPRAKRPRRPATTACCRRWCVASSTSTASIPTRSPGRAQEVGSPATMCSTTSTPPARHSRPLPRPLPLPLLPPPRSRAHRLPPRHPLRAAPAPAASAPAAAPAPTAPAPKVGAGERDSAVRLSKIRQLTGDHMVMSKAISPHAFSVVEVDFANVDVVRTAKKAEWKAQHGFSLTYLPFIARAIIDGLAEFPHLNASVSDSELIVHNFIDLGIAVDLDYEGLLAPVVRDADTKRLGAIASEIFDLADRARSRKLTPDEISGGTFTISNNGSAGSVLTMPIINQPQVAIISTDAIVRKPVVTTGPDGGEAIAIHPVGNLAMSWDHRAFDGAYAAGFLKRVKEILETKDWNTEL